jgi:hypothetical protein
MQVWDQAQIKAESNHPKKGRAGVVQSVEVNRGTGEVLSVTLKLDHTEQGDDYELVKADIKDVIRLSK